MCVHQCAHLFGSYTHKHWSSCIMVTQIQQQQQQTRVRAAHEMEQVTTELLREKEQIQPQLETRTEKEQLRTESQLQTANTRADEEIRQLQLQVSDIIVTTSCKFSLIHGYHYTGPTTTAAGKSKS